MRRDAGAGDTRPRRGGEARLVAALRARGQRVTAQRLVIAPPAAGARTATSTAEEVLRRAGAAPARLSLPTVYATLDLLAELGLARRVSAGGPVLYDPRPEDHVHAALPLAAAASRTSRPTSTPAPALQAARAAGFAPDTAEVVVGGLCARCAAAVDA